MKHLSHFKTASFDIEVPNLDTKVTIWIFGDVHRDLPNCDVDRWHWFLKRAKQETDPEHTYYISMGDTHDFASAREGLKLRTMGMHDQSLEMLSEMVQKRNRAFCTEIAQMRGKLIGLVGGNHTWILENGITADEDLANRMGCQYLGWLSYVNLRLKFASRQTLGGVSFPFVLCHGLGGGRVLGSQVRKVEDLFHIFPDAMVYCISEDTEILTERGWMSYDKIDRYDTVYTLDAQTDTIKKSQIKSYVCYDYEGDMINIKNKVTDQLLHPGHRVYYKTRFTNKYNVRTAGELYNSHAQYRFPLSGQAHSLGVDMTNDQIALSGWLLSDGHFKGESGDTGSGILIYQKRGEKADIIRELLIRLKYSYSEKLRTDDQIVFYIKKKDALKIREFISNKKCMPEWVYDLNKEQFDIFLDAFILGDGSYIDGSATIYGKDKNLMEGFQRALIINGYRNYIKHRRGGFKNGCYVVGITEKNKTDINTKRGFKKVPYKGKIWCIETEHGTFIARRKGKCFITGNCMGHDHSRGAWPQSRLFGTHSKNGVKLKQVRQFYIRSGSFMKSYQDDESAYPVGKLMRPADLGAIRLELSCHRSTKNGDDELIKDIEARI
jgi:hypothetical protein